MEIRSVGKLTVKELAANLLQRAKNRFPTLVLTGELAFLPGDIVYRIYHQGAITDGAGNQSTWVAIIPMTTTWRSQTAKMAVIDEEEDLTTRYAMLVAQAIELGLFNPEEFAIAE
jgi:hypothetical protein